MRPEVKRWFKIVFCTLMVVFSVSIGFSDWAYPDNSGDKTTGNGQPTQNEEIPVAYLLSDPTRTYSKVEDAINKANLSSHDEVVVPILTAKNATITKNVTINSNVTLNIPYEVNAKGAPTANAAKSFVQDGSTFVSNSSAVFTLNIAPNVTLTNYGTIEIGGVLGSGGGGANTSGQTCGPFSKIELDSNSCIDNHNLLFCYGLITEKSVNNTSKIICEESGRIDEPFIVRDFKGGSATYAAYQGSKYKFSPFNLFEVRNILPLVQFKSGSQLKGWANLYANNDFQAMTFDIIGGSSPIIDLASGSYLNSKYVSSDGNYTTEGYCKLDFYGSVNVNSLSFKFTIKVLFSININISTEKGFFPISYLLKINFHAIENQSCIVNTGNQGFKIMPGSSLIVDKGVTLITSELIIYPQGQVNQVVSSTYKKTELPDVKVNGVLAATAVGGQIDVENEGSVLSRANGDSVTSYEITNVERMSVSSKDTYTQQLAIRLIKNNVVSETFEDVSGKKYLSRTISLKSGYEEYTENFPITIKYIAGANAKSATKEVPNVNLYDVHRMLSEKDLNSFINTGYMIENFTAYTDGTSSKPLTINTGNSVFLSEFVFSDIKETKILYIKVNCVKDREITIKYESEWNNILYPYTFTDKIKYPLNDSNKLYRLKTIDELSFSLGRKYCFQNYELYPGVTSKKGAAAMIVEDEGSAVDFGSEQLIDAWNNSCMFVYVNRQRK